jgi:hypothetical protein
MSPEGGERAKHMIDRNNYITRGLALAAAAVVGGLATAAFLLSLWPDKTGEALLNAGGFEVLPVSSQGDVYYPLVNDALRDLLRRMEDRRPGADWIEDNVSRSITIEGEQEYPKYVTLTITERGWHDDEVAGVAMRYRLDKSSNGWRVTRAEKKTLWARW